MPAKLLGAHLSTAKGLGAAVREGRRIGCSAVQVFTSSPRMWKGSPADPAKAADLRAACAECGIDALVSHDTYLVNLCHPDPEVAAKSLATLRDELVRSAAYGIPYVVSHMGALVGQDQAAAFPKVAEAATRILSETPDGVTLLMETTAGQGSSINSRFDEIARLLDLAGAPPRLGVCLDTCHVFAAGYDLRTPEAYAATFAEFDRLVGLERLKVIHGNDSKKGLGSRVDRHAHIGEGEIGLEGFRCLVNDPRFENVPILLETPAEDRGQERDLATLRSLFSTG